MDDSDQELEERSEAVNGWSMTRILGLILIVAAAVVALYIVVAVLAWQSGQSIRSEREDNQLAEQLDRQVSLAQNDISQGSYNLALRRLEWILDRDPENADAQAIKQQAEAALKTALTPEAPPTATPPLEPSPTPGRLGEPDVEFERLQRMDEQERWQELLESTLVFQQQYPDYERLETDRFLYNSYVNLGLQYIQGDAIELGINYFSQAE